MELNASPVYIIAAAPDKLAPLYFLCRSGARSKSAAASMTQAGYANCYNIAPGFEGPHDGAQHRGSVEGESQRLALGSGVTHGWSGTYSRN